MRRAALLLVLADCPAPPQDSQPGGSTGQRRDSPGAFDGAKQREERGRYSRQTGTGPSALPPFLSQLDAIDARVSQLVAARDACAELVRRTDYAARQKPGHERRRAQRGVLRAHVAAREAIDLTEGMVRR